jgi:hypothetical protein
MTFDPKNPPAIPIVAEPTNSGTSITFNDPPFVPLTGTGLHPVMAQYFEKLTEWQSDTARKLRELEKTQAGYYSVHMYANTNNSVSGVIGTANTVYLKGIGQLHDPSNMAGGDTAVTVGKVATSGETTIICSTTNISIDDGIIIRYDDGNYYNGYVTSLFSDATTGETGINLNAAIAGTISAGRAITVLDGAATVRASGWYHIDAALEIEPLVVGGVYTLTVIVNTLEDGVIVDTDEVMSYTSTQVGSVSYDMSLSVGRSLYLEKDQTIELQLTPDTALGGTIFTGETKTYLSINRLG